MRNTLSWQKLGWRHDVWDLVRFYRSLRQGGEAWLSDLKRSNMMKVEEGANLPIDTNTINLLSQYVGDSMLDRDAALLSLRTEPEALRFCKELKVKVGKTTTQSKDHYQSSKALIGAVTALADQVCSRLKVALVGSPQRRNVWCTDAGLHVSARNLDGSIASLTNARIVWEIKEYWGGGEGKAGGSKMSDAVYECNLVGRELREYESRSSARIIHVVFLDGKDQWESRKSDLLRFVDLEHQGVVDRLFIGKEVEAEWPGYLEEQVKVHVLRGGKG